MDSYSSVLCFSLHNVTIQGEQIRVASSLVLKLCNGLPIVADTTSGDIPFQKLLVESTVKVLTPQ